MNMREILLLENYPKQGVFIAQRLIEMKKTQTWLAQKTKTTIPQISLIINGKSKPSLMTALRISNALGVSLDELAKSFL